MRVALVKDNKYTCVEVKEASVDKNVMTLTSFDNNEIKVEFKDFDIAMIYHAKLVEQGYIYISNLKNYNKVVTFIK